MTQKTLPKCFNLREHQRTYSIEIARIPRGDYAGAESVVYWCKECGACVVDLEYDHRCMDHLMKMKFPSIIEEMLK